MNDTNVETALDMVKTGWEKYIFPALSLVYQLDYQNDVNFDETPSRIAKALILEKCRGINPRKEIKEILSKTFPTNYTGLIKVGPIDAYGVCPHHFETVSYKATFGYMPKTGGHAVGLSKIPRMIKLLAKAPILQEDLTTKIVDYFVEFLEPEGCGVIVKGQHGCMLCRGVETSSECWVVTSAVRGIFETCSTIKSEFLKL